MHKLSISVPLISINISVPKIPICGSSNPMAVEVSKHQQGGVETCTEPGKVCRLDALRFVSEAILKTVPLESFCSGL